MFKKAAEWLVPKGRFYLITASPYHYATPLLPPLYEKRIKEGNEWPGEVTDFTFHIGNEPPKTTGSYLHAMDPRVIFRVATKYGFIVKKIELYGGKEDVDYTAGIFINGKE